MWPEKLGTLTWDTVRVGMRVCIHYYTVPNTVEATVLTHDGDKWAHVRDDEGAEYPALIEMMDELDNPSE